MTLFNQIEKVTEALLRHFNHRRIVFWYDDGEQMREQYEAIEIDGIAKLVIENNEFTLKYRMLSEEPKSKFLVYAPCARPKDKDNWLLDVLLSNQEFHADILSLYLQEVGLPLEYKNIIVLHRPFFDSAERRDKLVKTVESTDSQRTVILKMIAVVCAADAELDKIWFALFDEAFSTKNNKYNLLEKSGLLEPLWNEAEKSWGYNSEQKSIKDLLVTLFSGYFNNQVGIASKFTPSAKLFFNRWKENIKGRPIYINWSKHMEEELGVKNLLSKCETVTLLDADVYPIIDRKVIADILGHIINKTLPAHVLQEWIDARKTKLFYTEYQNIYSALSAASAIQSEIVNSSFNLASVDDMFAAYSAENGWYVIDRLYRKYIYHSNLSEYQDLLKPLNEFIDKLYSNSYLLPLSDTWQQKIDTLSKWALGIYTVQQREFYKKWIVPYTKKENRVFVIISDALRYESMTELRERILAEDRYSAELTPTLGVLPSYTQLGMAAMMPHKALSYDNENDTVFVDGVSSSGTVNRTKILQKEYIGSIAINAEEFLAMKASTNGREFCKQYNVIYIYSNTIDKIGDDKTSESRVFMATEDELTHLTSIVKHIANMNGNNIIITSDHGYIYQNSRLESTDFTEFSPSGNVYKTNRRFVIGKELLEDVAVKKWSANELLLNGEVEVLVAKSINRIRVQGAGSRFVHGGATLQEIVVPVLEVNRKRKDVLEQVGVDVIGLPTAITGNILPINFYQQKTVTEKVTSLQIKAAFYTNEGAQISDTVNLLFDCRDSDSRKREQRYTFTFTPDASKYNKEEVKLILETPIAGSSQYKFYKSYNIKMMIAFCSEFDF